MLSKKIRISSIIIGIVLFILWFGGNFGLYFYLNYIFTDKDKKAINLVPEKLILKEASLDLESLYFYGFKLKLPYYREDIRNITSYFDERHELENFLIIIDNGNGFISISKHPPVINKKKSLIDWFAYKSNSYYEIIRAIHYSRLRDFNWWNLFHNIGLSERLKWKVLLTSNSEVYDLETPYLKGFLSQSKEEGNKWLIMLDFELKDKSKNESYHIGSAGFSENNFNKIKDIINTIQSANNIESSYKEIEILLKNKENSRYPEELLLVSMISLKGPTIDNLKTLLKIMEKKKYPESAIENIKKLIKTKKGTVLLNEKH